MTYEKDDIRGTVQEYYANAAARGSSCCDTNDLYQPQLLDELPFEIGNFSLGCGDPITLANLKPGETVLDLGSGGGLDCFLAAREVGKQGHVIGIDMTPEMLERARQAAERIGATNVEFREGFMEKLPVDDDSIDVVISNCVINLSPDKDKVFSEIARALKPGGRIAVSDIVSNGQIPEEILRMKNSWASCAAGALPMKEFADRLENAGLQDVKIQAKDGKGGLFNKIPETGLFSALISAHKPSA
jgi:SAM-dependent methyltransferase